jgi:hypothetical protein
MLGVKQTLKIKAVTSACDPTATSTLLNIGGQLSAISDSLPVAK